MREKESGMRKERMELRLPSLDSLTETSLLTNLDNKEPVTGWGGQEALPLIPNPYFP